jgi:hypothetical protein
VLSLDADTARGRYKKIFARFAIPESLQVAGAEILKQQGRDVELLVTGDATAVMDRLQRQSPESISTEALTLEEIFVRTVSPLAGVA